MEKERLYIRISKEDFFGYRDCEQWLVFERTLEKRLENGHYEFELEADDNSLVVFVDNKSDALKLSDELRLSRIRFFDGVEMRIILMGMNSQKGQRVRIENTEGKRLTVKQYKKQMVSEKDFILKSDVIKRGIFTKAEMEKILRSGALVIEQYGGKNYLNRGSIKEYIMRKK